MSSKITTAWAHLPNAKYIDWVIASVKNDSAKWIAASNAASYSACNSAINVLWEAGRETNWGVAKRNELGCSTECNKGSAREAIIALFAYDDSAQYLTMDLDKLKVYVRLSENPAAILLIHACRIWNEEQMELTND